MTSKSKKIAYAFSTVICFLVAGLMLFIGFGIPAISFSRYNESNTYEYEATFIKKETSANGWQIYVREYDCFLTFASGALADKQNLYNLTAGDKLSFRSEMKIETIEETENINSFPIVTLSSEGNDIVTFESSKAFEEKETISNRITCIVFT
ncbi:MAG: hypothetical protein K2J83_05570, partial [Clostridia bacterium]|nr:hypothetical protein [Clostridia bacterium]